MSENFTVLADVYQSGGLADYGATLAAALLNYAYELDWTGGAVLDLGCGTGETACYLASRNLSVLGVDSAPSMLKYAERLAEERQTNARFIQTDLRTYRSAATYDLVLALGVVNYMATREEVTQLFQAAAHACPSGKLFAFDLRTLLGLSQTPPIRLVSDTDRVYLVAQSAFSHETMSLAVRYTFFQRTSGWIRAEETHTLRGYPIQFIERRLAETGFTVQRLLALNMQPAEVPQACETLLVVAQRQ